MISFPLFSQPFYTPASLVLLSVSGHFISSFCGLIILSNPNSGSVCNKSWETTSPNYCLRLIPTIKASIETNQKRIPRKKGNLEGLNSAKARLPPSSPPGHLCILRWLWMASLQHRSSYPWTLSQILATINWPTGLVSSPSSRPHALLLLTALLLSSPYNGQVLREGR